MEIQQRADVATFRKHYCHIHDAEVEAALNYAWENPGFGGDSSEAAHDGGASTSPARPSSPRTASAATVTDSGPGASAEPAMQNQRCRASADRGHPPVAEPQVTDSGPGASDASRMHSHCSRNAWRKSKRKAGKATFLQRTSASREQSLTDLRQAQHAIKQLQALARKEVMSRQRQMSVEVVSVSWRTDVETRRMANGVDAAPKRRIFKLVLKPRRISAEP